MDAPGVDYFEIQAGEQSVRLFHCQTHRCDLSQTSCAERFKSAQGLHPTEIADNLHRCKRCRTGAAHADIRAKPAMPRTCVRCKASGTKLVRHLLCVPCFNRQMEVVNGRDRRGHPPRTAPYFWSPQPERKRGVIPMIAPVVVQAGDKTLTFLAATFREALESASRLAYKGTPIEMRVLNAPDVARTVPRYPVTPRPRKAA